MKIEKEYKYNNVFDGKCYKVIISVKNDENEIMPVFCDIDKLSNNSEYIDLDNICNEDFLNQNEIEYEFKEDKVNDITNIIPTGLINFFSVSYAYSELYMITKNKNELHKMEQTINNVEKAIKIKYEAFKFDNKCKQNKTEIIELD